MEPEIMEPENNENELVFEMITFSKKNHKCLPANLCISTSEFGFDDPKIKIQQDTDEEIHMEHAFFMTVPEKEIIGDPGTLDNEMLDYFRTFIDNNEEALIKFWYEGKNLDTMDVIDSLIF